MVQHLSRTEACLAGGGGGGGLNHYGTVFSVTRRRSATNTFYTYCGD